jgi:hypothetical protein
VNERKLDLEHAFGRRYLHQSLLHLDAYRGANRLHCKIDKHLHQLIKWLEHTNPRKTNLAPSLLQFLARLMFASTTLFCLVTSLLAVLPSTIAVGAPAGEEVIFKVNTSNTASMSEAEKGVHLLTLTLPRLAYCLYELGDLSLTVNACDDDPETMALVSTLGSAASTTPPVGTITHQYIPTTFLPRNGTYCLAANATTSTIVTINEGTKVIMKPCVSTDVTQQWAIRDGDGTIRLGNSNKCLTLKFGATVSSPQTLVIGTCAAGEPFGVLYIVVCIVFILTKGNVDQKWTPIPKPPSRGLTGYE